jgi:tRNA-(ms[2]io[6]A)-hydroxylase
MFHHPTEVELLQTMSRIAREELIHFDQVCRIIQTRNIRYGHLSASRYARGLRHLTRSHEPGRLIDRLIISAFIEARSCERFACLVPHLDNELSRFYRYLLKSEARHYQDYLALTKTIAVRQLGKQCNLSQRIELFRQQETELIQAIDSDFRFHSGSPTAA